MYLAFFMKIWLLIQWPNFKQSLGFWTLFKCLFFQKWHFWLSYFTKANFHSLNLSKIKIYAILNFQFGQKCPFLQTKIVQNQTCIQFWKCKISQKLKFWKDCLDLGYCRWSRTTRTRNIARIEKIGIRWIKSRRGWMTK